MKIKSLGFGCMVLSMGLWLTACRGEGILVDSNPTQEAVEAVDGTPIEPDAAPDLVPGGLELEGEETQRDVTLRNRMATMTLEEKVGQLFVVDFYSFAGRHAGDLVGSDLADQLARYPIGGVIFFGPDIQTPEQVSGFIQELQSLSAQPLWVAVDEEGGIVRRIGQNLEMGLTFVPTAWDMGDTGDTDAVYDIANTLGQEMRALGFNMNFAPVADVHTNPENPIIGHRAFSDDPHIVADMVVAFMSGLQEAKVLAVAKHFPGHGDTQLDSHLGDVYVHHDIERLQAIELVPFQAAVEAGIDGIMVAHIVLEAVTGHTDVATFSKELLTKMLREDMGFEGLVITDALNMHAVSKRYPPEAAGVLALEAGNDLLLMPDDFDATFQGIVEAVRSGRISGEALDEIVYRILKLKAQYGLYED